ncbi:unnamed protein product [Caenorhabditis auriculariae]|uniref:N-terminal acetyltransferase B complex subunit MDM20 homolog n=1 Tax=Caenorhabditis auriculariae TaxID=2777116 RepID=A0A8S1GWX8_9PELO|nr:unnamed protein product [Caenorhabditis auriculariae]
MSKADQAVLERRIRPIYDALDNGNPKKAFQEAEKILKKHPNTVCAKVLKALALIRNEKLSEALIILDALDVAGVRHDESTMMAFVHCYKDADVPERINLLYERAVEMDPTENHLTQLFMAYVRTKKYKKQQEVGLRLFKEYQNTPYYFWAIMSIVMQATENPSLGEKMLYPLAEKMLQAHIQKHGYSNGAEIDLHTMILEGMKKSEEAYCLLTSPNALNLPIPPMFMNEKRVQLLMQAGRYAAVKVLAEKEIGEYDDNWSMWQALFDSSLKLIEEAQTKGDFTEATRLLDEMIALVSEHCGGDGNAPSKNRGPYLARLELIKRMANAGQPIREALGEPVEFIVHFVKKFYKKPSCFTDVKLYMCLLNEEQRVHLNDLLTCFISDLVHNEDGSCEGEDKVWAIIVYERLRRITGFWAKESPEKLRQHVQQIIAQIAQPNRSELAMGALTHLIVSVLWEVWRKEDDVERFYEMILLLEYVAAKNASDPLSKLVLLRAYGQIGNTTRIAALTKLLDIKSVQCESLGYLTFPVFEAVGRFNLAVISNTQLSMVYEQADKEVMECLLGAYKNGKFTQIPRLVHLEQTMKMSTQAISCDVMNRYLSSLFCISDLDEAITTMYGDEESIDWNKLCDNRDLDVIPSLEPYNYQKLLDDMKKRSYCEFADISRLRHLLCRAFAAVGRVTRSDVSPAKSRNELTEYVSLFNAHLEYCLHEYLSMELPSRLLQSPTPMRLAQWVHSGGLQIVRRFLQVALDIVPLLDNGQIPSESVLGSAEQLSAELKAVVEVFPREKMMMRPFYAFEPICAASRALQTLASLQLIFRLLDRLVCRRACNKESSKDSKKAGKKAEQKGSGTPFSERCKVLLCEVLVAAKTLNVHLTELFESLSEEEILPNKLADDLGQAQIVLSCRREQVDSRILRSYVMAIEDMQTTISSWI